MKGLTGSEVHCLQLGHYFVSQGATVTFLGFERGDPMASEIQQLGARLVAPFEILGRKFDLIWTHHDTTFAWVHSFVGASARRHIHGILSVQQRIERVPPIPLRLKNDLLRLIANSEETRSHAVRHSGRKDILVMPNVVPQAFYENFRDSLPPKPKRIAIVSNHPPVEVCELKVKLENHGLDVTIFGRSHRYIPIDHETLMSFDVVITIGKTVQYCLAQGIPVFIYDWFGGPGYLDTVDFESHAKRNFSGRSDPRKRSADELAREILVGYRDAAGHATKLRTNYSARFSIDQCVWNAIEKLEQRPLPVLTLRERCKTVLNYVVDRPQALGRTLAPRLFKAMTAAYDRALKFKNRKR